jgi:hypothetical protein
MSDAFIAVRPKPSFIPFELELPASGRGGSIVSRRAELDLTIDNSEVEIVYQVTVAAHFAQFAFLGPDPFAIHDLMIAVSHRSDLGQGQRVRSFYEEKSNDAY